MKRREALRPLSRLHQVAEVAKLFEGVGTFTPNGGLRFAYPSTLHLSLGFSFFA